MAEHKLKHGIKIINKIYRLGEILDYNCEREHFVNQDNESAVDVAWLKEKGQKYPLFIFEIESATTSGITANPLKVYGESNRKFEKPLFFFHILLKGGQESGKVSQLETVFGTHNYRIYRFSLLEELLFIKDVLSQHRRLTNFLPIFQLLTELIENWQININEVIAHIELLNFEGNQGEFLPSYAMLYKKYPFFKEVFISALKRKSDNEDTLYAGENYGTYFGNEWSVPVHLGVLSAFSADGLEKKYFNKFKVWQEDSAYVKQIGPYFGLARDYDLFILGASGALFGLLSLLFYKVEGAREYFANEVYLILKKSQEGYGFDICLYNAVWLLYISPNNSNGKITYEYAKNFINENGGVPIKIYKEPMINYISVLESEEDIDDFGERIYVPDWGGFQDQTSNISNDEIFNMVINYLIDIDENWNPVKNGYIR